MSDLVGGIVETHGSDYIIVKVKDGARVRIDIYMTNDHDTFFISKVLGVCYKCGKPAWGSRDKGEGNHIDYCAEHVRDFLEDWNWDNDKQRFVRRA